MTFLAGVTEIRTVLKASVGAVACQNTHFAAFVNNEQFMYHCSCMESSEAVML
jgi:predicted SprT family Zn-dependent metalloprotease